MLCSCSGINEIVLYHEVRRWWAPPAPTPVPLGIRADGDAAARAAVYGWLNQQGFTGQAEPQLEELAYLLASESPHYRRAFRHTDSGWPVFRGYRYVVGAASGKWTVHWNGCAEGASLHYDGTLWHSQYPRAPLALHPFPGLAGARQLGVGVVWREGEQIIGVLWPRDEPCPPVVAPAYGNALPPSGPAP